ncbi:oxysterol-binding protein-related protein 3 isoform X2 [Dendrobates tinctorius]
MSVKKSTKCIDLDTEEHIYHLKVKPPEVFEDWVLKLRDHRLFRQNEISVFPHDINTTFYPLLSATESTSSFDPISSPQETQFTRQNSLKLAGGLNFSCINNESKVPAWLQSNDDMDKCAKDLSQCHSYLVEMSQLLQNMEVLHRTYSAPAINAIQVGALESPKKEKGIHRKKWRAKGNNKDAKGSLQVPPTIAGNIRLHASNPNLSTIDYAEEKQYSSGSDSSEFSKMQDDLCHIAHKAYFTLKSAYSSVFAERERLKQLIEQDSSPTAQMGLKNALAAETPHQENRTLVHQMSNESRRSITDSLTEFFDAQEVLLSSSSSENEVSDDDSYVSDISDNISEDNLSNDIDNERQSLDGACEVDGFPKHRTCLPAPCPNTSNISLWNILRNNIGKDLSKVSMPVQLNEPLNTLQRLCEELEYSELLDKAAETQDPFERMVYVATFAVSAYASSFYRAGSKPFNPVLGETYECVNEDKGFRFIAEQVSHHPPVSACHAESENFVLYQDIRWKNKFWGKSMEIVPVGTTHLTLPRYGDHYEWNKVTSCIHNILSGQRWIEHYGEIIIKNTKNNNCHCKVTFVKAKYWNPNVHEIEGSVMDRNGKVVYRLFGKWHESLFYGSPSSPICIWRTNPMPKEYELYYGFTKFALRLNELEPKTKPLLPSTDTRLRPDQRLLEEGNVEGAEAQKQRIEQLQRERRRVLEENNLEHQPRFFRKCADDTWMTNNMYWPLRKEPGFAKLDCPIMW